MIRLKATDSALSAEVTEPITTGSVGLPVEVELSRDYDGLTAWLTFDAGGKSADVIINGEPIEVPAQCLRHAGNPLKVGIYATRADGKRAIATIWANCGTIREGASPSGFEPSGNTPSWAAYLQGLAERALEVATEGTGRVTALNGCEIESQAIEAKGVPTYVSDVSEYAEWGITESGWYVFARVKAKDGVRTTEATTVTGAAGSIVEADSDHVDVAVRFDVAAMSCAVTIEWDGTETDHYVFRATDLAIRNLDYRTTFYVYDISEFVTWEFAPATDERFVHAKAYHKLVDGEYVKDASVVAGDPATYHTRLVTHPPAPAGEAFVGTEYWVVDEQSELGHSRAAVMAGAPIPEGEYFTHSYQKLTAAGKFAEGVRYYKLVDDEYVLQEVTVGASYAKNVYYIDAWTAATGTFVGTAYCAETGGEWHQAAVVAGETIPEGAYGLHEVSWPQALGTFEAGVTYYNYVGAATGYEFDGCAWVHDAGMYEVAEVTPGDTIPEWHVHTKAIFEGMARNVTYQLPSIIDCPIEFRLPDIPNDGYGAWYEVQMRYQATYSMTLTPESSDVKAATDATQGQTAGVNIIDLHYADVAGAKLWRMVNTHSSVKLVPAALEFRRVPAKTAYAAGEELDVAGAELVVTYTDGTKQKLATNATGLTFAPENGAALTADDTELVASYVLNGTTVTASTPITVE